jgi:hypothetical protein
MKDLVEDNRLSAMKSEENYTPRQQIHTQTQMGQPLQHDSKNELKDCPKKVIPAGESRKRKSNPSKKVATTVGETVNEGEYSGKAG